MNVEQSLSRIARRRADESTQTPRTAWRLVAILPTLALVMLLAIPGTLAWFSGAASVPTGSATSATFADLMTVGSESLSFSGTTGTFSGSFTVTRNPISEVPGTETNPFNVSATWAGTPGLVNVSMNRSTLAPGDSATVTVSGAYGSTFSGDIKVAIGSNGYDWGLKTLSVTKPAPIDTVIDVAIEQGGLFFGTGTSGVKFENLLVATIYQKPNTSPITINIALSQDPVPGVYGKGGTTTTVYPVTLASPNPFTTSSGGYQLKVNQDLVAKDYPICVTATLTSSGSSTSKNIYFLLAHNGDQNNYPACGDIPAAKGKTAVQGALVSPGKAGDGTPGQPDEGLAPQVDGTDSAATEPEATEPEATEPEATEPEATEPEATEPEATEPEATEPAATEPEATEPEATEPEATEPGTPGGGVPEGEGESRP